MRRGPNSWRFQVRDAVLNDGEEIFDGFVISANASKMLTPRKERLEATAREVIRNTGFDYDVRLEIGKDFSWTRTYDDRRTLPAGEYEAVRVIIGEGEG
jgi:Stage II sporulation protein R (spore_II_R).